MGRFFLGSSATAEVAKQARVTSAKAMKVSNLKFTKAPGALKTVYCVAGNVIDGVIAAGGVPGSIVIEEGRLAGRVDFVGP